jgi:hypothetical protein
VSRTTAQELERLEALIDRLCTRVARAIEELRELRSAVAPIEPRLAAVEAAIPRPPELLTVEQARSLYGVSERSLYRARARGELSTVRVGVRTCWHRDQVAAMAGRCPMPRRRVRRLEAA